MKNRPKNIIAILPIAGQDGLDKYSGLVRYVTERDLDWNIIVDRLANFADALSIEEIRGADAVIVDGAAPAETRKSILQTAIPLAAIDWQIPSRPPRRRRTLYINADDREISIAAQRAINDNGNYAAVAFMPALQDFAWSKRRNRHFCELMRGRGIEVSTLSHGKTLGEQLRRLAKPAAIFAANDRAAQNVLKAARQEGIVVPQDLSVIGVDNSRFICLHTNPPLSSIQPDFEAAGYKAAAAIDAILSGRSAPVRQSFGVKTVVRRTSMEPFGSAGRLVHRAKIIIRDCCTRKENIDSIARRLGVSRRLLDRRFRQIEGKSVLETILEHKIENACNLLRTTDLSISYICSACALGQGTYPQRLFRKRTGMTMREYRRLPK